MAELPVMQLFVERILADTIQFSTEQRGAYAWLLFAMWANGARLKNDEDQLMRITGVKSRARWRTKIWPAISPKFTVAGDEISQKRLTSVWMMTQEKRKKLSENASRGRAKYLQTLDRTAANAPPNQNQNIESSLSFVGREMSAEEFMRLKQRRAPLPVALKQRDGR